MNIVQVARRFRLQERLPSESSYISMKTFLPILTHRPGWIDDLYLSQDIFSKKTIVLKLKAIKESNHTLEHKFYIYKNLKRETGIPLMHWFSIESGFNVITINCLGSSLQDLFICSHCQFIIKNILLLTSQLVSKFNFWGYDWYRLILLYI